MKKIFTAFIVLFILTMGVKKVSAQASTANYAFASATNGSLTDMSSGTTQLIAGDITNGVSTVQEIGFDFYFMGVKYTQFGVSSNGVFRFGGAPPNTATNNLTSTTSTLRNILAPFWDALATHSTGGVRYKVTGSAPNRILTVEWYNMRITATSTTPNATFQIRLYETTGKFEFVYGSMNIGAGSGTVTASIGFKTLQANNNVLSVTNITTPAVTTTAASVVNNLVNSNAAGPITALNSSSDGNRVIYSFTPPASNTPTSLLFTSILPGGMTLNWSITGNAANYFVYISTDNVNFNLLATVPGGTTSYSAAYLTSNTNYYWKIYSVSEGILNNIPLEGSQSTPAGVLSGLKTIGPAGDYTLVQDAFNAINTQGLAGPVILEIQAGYNPAFEPDINCYGNSSGNTSIPVILRPALGVTGLVFSSVNITFNFDATKYLTIDGRPGGIGTSQEITITNSGVNTAIRFINDACNNTIKYCKISTSNNATAINISSTTGIRGSDNNTIDNCEISGGNNLIYSSQQNNDTITVSNCRMFDFLQRAISLEGGNNHVITGNSFYQSTSAPPNVISANTVTMVFISGGGNNHLISGNYFGGQDINCGGSAYLNSGSSTMRVIEVNFSGNVNTIPVTIQNNIIQNFNLIGTGNRNFIGIDVNTCIANVTGNTIGHDSTANSIVSAGSSAVIGINTSNAIQYVSFSNNIIANITTTNTTGGNITAIAGSGTFDSFSDTLSISNNTIHDLTSRNNTTGISTSVYLETINIRANNIFSLKSLSTVNSTISGIVSSSQAGAINKNRIYDLSNTSAGNIFGIRATFFTVVPDYIITNNQISVHNIPNTNDVSIKGISIPGGKVYYNSVYVGGSISSGSKTSSSIYKDTNTVFPGVGLDVRNNIFYNERTGGTGSHYALDYTNNNNITSDYNLLVGPASTIARWGTIDYDFADYKTNSGKDLFSLSNQPVNIPANNLFVDKSVGNMNILSANNEAFYSDGKGIPIAGQLDDYSSTNVRDTSITQGTTDIGSDEFDYTGSVPDLMSSAPPALNTTTTYSFGGRQLVSITWGNTGTVQSSVTVTYNSGVNPPGTLTGQYSQGYWEVTPTGDSGYTYDITLNYSPAILFNIADENNIKIAKRDGGNWDYLSTATVNTANKTVTATGLNSFSQFALTSSDAPLPVELASFTSMAIRNEVILDWATSSEINNASFEIERSQVNSSNTNNFQRVGSIQGNGTTNETKNYKFNDRNIQTGKYKYRLKQIDFNGNFQYFDLNNEVEVGIPRKYDLSQNYPNPFNPVTKINYDMPKDGKVNLRIYDITGREVAALINNEVQSAGYYTITFNSSNLSSGVYFYRLATGDFVSTKKMMLIK